MMTESAHRIRPSSALAVSPLPSFAQRWEGAIERGYVQLSSETIYAEISGAGRPLILIHGLGGSSHCWAWNVPALAHSCRVHVIDLLGFGRSRGQRFVLREAAGLLVRWMDQRGLGRASVVGHFMGGLIAACLAAQFPERVERLGLLAAAVLPVERHSLHHAWRLVRGSRTCR